MTPRRTRSVLFAPLLASVAALGAAGCGEGSPYAAEDSQATEGTGELPEGAVNRSLNPGDAGTVGEPEDEPHESADGDEPADGDAVTAKPVSYEQFREVIEAADGPVLVDCWATWCQHCREAFPHTVKLAREHADDGLTVVSLAYNGPQEDGQIAEFLTEQEAGGLTNLRTDDGGNSDQWEPLGGAALPILLVFDAEGNEVARITGGGEEAERKLDAAVKAALGS